MALNKRLNELGTAAALVLTNLALIGQGTNAFKTELSNLKTLFNSITATGTPTARSLQARAADVINVKNHGATGDGVTDDTLAIQAALDAAKNNTPRGGIVFCPMGTYLITSALLIYSDTTLMGESSFGGRGTKLQATTDINILKTPGVSGTIYQGVAIMGVHFENTATTVTNYHVHLINTILSNIENCFFRSDPNMTGANVGGLQGSTLGVAFGSSYSTYVSNCFFNHASIAMNNVTDCQFIQNEIWGTNRVFTVEFVNCASSSMFACNMVAGTTGGVVITGTKATNYEYRFFNVDFSGAGQDGGRGCSFTDVERSKIIGCTFTSNDEEGLYIEDCDDIGVIGNTFHLNNDDDSFFDDILITGVSLAPRRIQIIGNTFERSAQTDKGRAIRLLASGQTPANINIAFNTIFGVSNYVDPAIVANLNDTDTVFENDGGGVTNTLRQGGDKLVLHFFKNDVAASLTDVLLALGPGTVTSYTMAHSGSVLSIAVRTFNARTAGTLTVEVFVDDVATGLTTVLDATDTFVNVTTQDADLDTFASRGAISVKVTTDASWAPTTADISVQVTVEV